MYAPQLIGERLRILKSLVPNLDKVFASAEDRLPE
jgi:hypothetical protein